MSPHIFAVAQTAYNEMSSHDRTIPSSSRVSLSLTRPTTLVICSECLYSSSLPQSDLTSEKFFATEVLLLSMGSVSTRLNRQATRFTNFTSHSSTLLPTTSSISCTSQLSCYSTRTTHRTKPHRTQLPLCLY